MKLVRHISCLLILISSLAAAVHPDAGRIQAPAGAPPYVLHALEDLKLQAGSGPGVPVKLEVSGTSGLGEEGFAITATAAAIRIAAADWRGLNYGILETVSLLARSADGHSLAAPFETRQRPAYGIRGMYAHPCWVYRYPFAVRTWKIADWKRYIDLLAYRKVNLLQVPVMASLVALPPAAADRQYLAMFREVADYARQERGFKGVWFGDAPNNVGYPNPKPIETREYFASQILRNPADPAGMDEIVRSRQLMYESAPNGDAYWVIDSDPGFWPDSPSSEFVHILAENRKLMNRLVENGADKELVYWVWDGWGRRSIAENQLDIIHSLQENQAGKFSLLGCRIDALRRIREAGLEDRTVWFPYNAVEYEPASPYTDLRFERVQASFACIRGYKHLRGVMANAQTPDVQFPNLWLFHRKAWDAGYAETDANAILRQAALDTYPRIAAELARAWELMAAHDSAAAAAMAEKLTAALRENRIGQPGTLGRFAFPDPKLLLENLADQLRTHARAIAFVDAMRGSGEPAPVRDAAEQYFQAARHMVELTGYSVQFNKKGTNQKPYFPWFYPTDEYNWMHQAWMEYKALRPGDADGIYRELKARHSLKSGYDLDGEMIEFLVGAPPPRIPGVDYRN